MGAQDVKTAKLYHNLSQIMGIISSILLAVIMFFIREPLAKVYTNLPDL